MAGLCYADHDVAHCAQILRALKVFRTSHLSRRCHTEGCAMDDGHGTGQSAQFCSVEFPDSLNRCAEGS